MKTIEPFASLRLRGEFDYLWMGTSNRIAAKSLSA
jgi:hypothetical protein